MATPQVAGAAALVWASPYGTSNEAVLSRLTSTADPIAGTGTYWIYGRLDAAAAVGLTGLASPAQVVNGLAAETSTQASTTTISAHLVGCTWRDGLRLCDWNRTWHGRRGGLD